MKAVLCNGCWDFLHYGHLCHLQTARTYGDTLIVAVATDEHILEMKGAGHPYFKLHQRVAMLRALAIVDDVLVTSSAEDVIRRVRPQIYVKGLEYQGRLKEQALVEALGGKVMFTVHEEGSIVKSGVVIPKYKNAIRAAGEDR